MYAEETIYSNLEKNNVLNCCSLKALSFCQNNV